MLISQVAFNFECFVTSSIKGGRVDFNAETGKAFGEKKLLKKLNQIIEIFNQDKKNNVKVTGIVIEKVFKKNIFGKVEEELFQIYYEIVASEDAIRLIKASLIDKTNVSIKVFEEQNKWYLTTQRYVRLQDNPWEKLAHQWKSGWQEVKETWNKNIEEIKGEQKPQQQPAPQPEAKTVKPEDVIPSAMTQIIDSINKPLR